jgi:hypothetical protein
MFTATATDHAGCRQQSVQPTIAAGPLTSTTVLPPGKLGQAYFAQLTATGGTPPYTWSLPSSYAATYAGTYGASPLPPGLLLNPNGTITGTLGAPAGDYPFTAQVTDSS